MDINKFVFSHAFANEEYGTMTFYFIACIDAILDDFDPELRFRLSGLLNKELAGISIEFPSGKPEPRFSSVEIGLYKTSEDGSSHIDEWLDLDLCYEDIGKLIDRGYSELKHCQRKENIVMDRKFKTGEIVVTAAIDQRMKDDADFSLFVGNSFGRYINCDWGDTCDEDKKSNEDALKYGDRLLAVYKHNGDTIWIITEWDRSCTTILFPEDY